MTSFDLAKKQKMRISDNIIHADKTTMINHFMLDRLDKRDLFLAANFHNDEVDYFIAQNNLFLTYDLFDNGTFYESIRIC